MPIPPAQLAAFAGKKKPQPQDHDDEEEGAPVAASEDADEEEGEDEEVEEGDEEDDIDVDAIGKQVEDGNWPDKGLIERARQVDDDSSPPGWALDEDIWEEAKDAVEDNWDTYDEPYAVVAAVYQKMGGEIEAAADAD